MAAIWLVVGEAAVVVRILGPQSICIGSFQEDLGLNTDFFGRSDLKLPVFRGCRLLESLLQNKGIGKVWV